MNVPDELEEVFILLAQDRFVSVLEQVSAPLMPEVEKYSVPGQKPLHEGRQFYLRGAKQKVEMIRHKRPRETRSLRFLQQSRQTLHKRMPIIVVKEDVPALNTPDDNMMKEPWHVNSWCTWHGFSIA